MITPEQAPQPIDPTDPEARADFIARLMRGGRWCGRSTIGQLAAGWGVPRKAVEEDARVALRSFATDAAEREMHRAEFLRRLRECQNEFRRDGQVNGMLESLKLEAKILGIDVPELMSQRGAVEEAPERQRRSPVEVSSLVRQTFGERAPKTVTS